MGNEPLEIEKRYLIEYPDIKSLAALSIHTIDISQSYLKGTAQGSSLRVRSSTENGVTTYTKTEKHRLSDLTRIEIEDIISESTYHELLKEKDPAYMTITKTRYCIPFDDLTAEIDILPFTKNFALFEVELPSEDKTFSIPSFVSIIKDVTDNRIYTNASLATILK